MLRIAIYSFVLVCCVLAETTRVGTPPMPNGRIVGGSDADIRDYPHQVSMRYKGKHRCGGTIIRPNIILTAAHCTDKTDKTQMNIVTGQSLLNATNVGLPVSKIIQHNKYSEFNNNNDAAILVLDGVLTFDDKTNMIKLAKSRPAAGTKCTATGWGALKEGGSGSNQLQRVDLSVIDESDCTKPLFYRLLVTEKMLCAGDMSGGKDSCQGDSGGPLVMGNELLGIVSWGNGCARPKYPGIYASVPDLYEWIEATANANAI